MTDRGRTRRTSARSTPALHPPAVTGPRTDHTEHHFRPSLCRLPSTVSREVAGRGGRPDKELLIEIPKDNQAKTFYEATFSAGAPSPTTSGQVEVGAEVGTVPKPPERRRGRPRKIRPEGTSAVTERAREIADVNDAHLIVHGRHHAERRESYERLCQRAADFNSAVLRGRRQRPLFYDSNNTGLWQSDCQLFVADRRHRRGGEGGVMYEYVTTKTRGKQ